MRKGTHVSQLSKEKNRQSHLGIHPNEESRRKMSISQKRRYQESPHHNLGKRPSDEAIAKQRNSLKKYYETHVGPFTGKHHSQITVEHLKNQKRSDESRRHISEGVKKYHAAHPGSQKGRDVSEKTKQKHRLHRSKLVMPFKDTKIEVVVQDYLSSIGMKFTKHIILKNVSPIQYLYHQYDIVIKELKIIVEVNGCYYHKCPQNCMTHYHPNIEKSHRRDVEIQASASRAGWKLIWLWEHDIRNGNYKSILNDSLNLKKSSVI
jgi:DNA mismatch endonuclease Vsr